MYEQVHDFSEGGSIASRFDAKVECVELPMYHILFVCTGNICRSPTAEGVLRKYIEGAGLAAHITVDSAGTHGYHVGEAPDPRSINAARKRGIALESLCARQVIRKDFDAFDLILALDHSHLTFLKRIAPKGSKAQVALFLDHAGMGAKEVDDPYYGSETHFEQTLDVIEEGCRGILKQWQHTKRFA